METLHSRWRGYDTRQGLAGPEAVKKVCLDAGRGHVANHGPLPSSPRLYGWTMGKRVLIVDDSMLMRRMIAECLATAGWEIVAEAATSQEAIQRYRQHRFDAVTLDIVMPEANGLSALERILREDPNAKIVIVSALNQTKLIAEAIRKGAQDFLAKPFMPDQLLETLAGCVAEEEAPV